MQRTNWRISVGACLAACGLSALTGFESSFLDRQSRLFAAEDSAKAAATVEDAIKVLDLRTFTLPEGAIDDGGRTVGALTYEAKADPKKAFQFSQQQLVKLGWKELPGSMVEATYAVGQFQKANFVVSLSTSDSGKPGLSRVSIINMSNVRANKLPVVKGAKSQYSTETMAMYVTDMKLADAIEATRKLLVDSGWEPYGQAGDGKENIQLTFKRNAVQISAFLGISPAQAGKTSIQLTAQQLSADIPAPANAKDSRYIDSDKTLRFESSDEYANIAKFYQQSLGKRGWKPTTEDVITSNEGVNRKVGAQVFRNAAKEMITLDMAPQLDQTLVKVTYLTAAEVVEADRKAEEQKKRLLAEKEKEKASAKTKTSKPMPTDYTPSFEALANEAISNALGGKGAKSTKPTAKGGKDAVSVPVPDKAKKVTQTSDNVLQIKVAAGKGQASAEFMRDQLVAAEWKVDDDADLDDTSGNLTFKKGTQQITLSYVDTGFTDVNLMLIGIGTKLEPGKADPNVKVGEKKPEPKSEPTSETTPDPKPSKKTAKKKSKSADDEPAPVVEPKRKERPKQGIAKLPKLPNEGTLTVNDKPIKLNSIIAYEVISGGTWHTKIVVTESPLKQDPLLAQLKKSGNDEGANWPRTRLEVDLDDEGQATLRVSTEGVAGSISGSKLKSDVLVEDGRARGTVQMKEPGEFFDKSFTGTISFDVSVLTRDSTPAKRLTDAPKLDNAGKLTMGAMTSKLANVVAYEVKSSDGNQTVVFITEKPINLAKLKASLAKDGSDDGLFEFQPQVRLKIDAYDRVTGMSLWIDGTSVSGNADVDGNVVIEDGRARGTAKLAKPGEFFGKNYTFEVTFDTEVMLLPKAKDE